jgi:hypothetical protein
VNPSATIAVYEEREWLSNQRGGLRASWPMHCSACKDARRRVCPVLMTG